MQRNFILNSILGSIYAAIFFQASLGEAQYFPPTPGLETEANLTSPNGLLEKLMKQEKFYEAWESLKKYIIEEGFAASSITITNETR